MWITSIFRTRGKEETVDDRRSEELEEIRRYLVDKMPFRAFILITDETELSDDEQRVSKFDYVKDDHSTVFTTMGLLEATRYSIMKGFD